MLARIFGVPLGFVTFFIVAYASGNFVGSWIPLVIGGVSAAGVWFFFRSMDKERLGKLLHPEAKVWAVPLPVAWGIIKDEFDGSIIRTKHGVIAAWSLKREDKSRGQLAAMLNFFEHGGCGPQGPSEARTVAATAELKPAGSTTFVSLNFEVFSPGCSELVEDIIRKCQRKLAREVKEYAGVGATINSGEEIDAGFNIQENRYV